jgi:hypothetical protein
MSWDEIEVQRGQRRDINRWAIAGSKSGGIRIYLAANHPLAQARRVRVFFGKGDDAGWMMIKASDTGGRTVCTATGGTKARYIQFSTLPFLPKGIKFAERELEIATAGADLTTVKVRLPWVSREGRPVAQQLWDTQAKAA